MPRIQNILVIGTGNAGLRHFQILRKICPYADVRIEETRNLNQKIELEKTLMHQDSPIEFTPELVVIASPASFHLMHASYFLEKNSHLFIEKPLADQLEGLLNFRDKAKIQRIKVAVGYNLRYSESLKFFKDCIKSNRVGKVLSVHVETGQYLPDWRPKNDYQASVSANKFLGGGVLLELSHELDYLLWIFGKCNSVLSTMRKLSSLEIDVEDSTYIIAEISTPLNQAPIISTVILDFKRRDITRACTAVGDHGSIKWDGILQTVQIYDELRKEWKILFEGKQEPDDTYTRELESFIQSIELNETQEVGLDSAIEVMKMIEAVRLSSAIGQRVEISDFEK